MSFNGTIQPVVEQVRAVNPDYNFNTTTSDIEPMGVWRDRKVARKDCNAGNFARGYYVADCISHLRHIRNEKCKLKHKGCARIACRKNAAISVCWDPNEDSPEEYEQSWDYVADYASGIAAGWWCDRILVPPGSLDGLLDPRTRPQGHGHPCRRGQVLSDMPGSHG